MSVSGTESYGEETTKWQCGPRFQLPSSLSHYYNLIVKSSAVVGMDGLVCMYINGYIHTYV